METDLDIQDRGEEGLRPAHFRQRIGFVDRETPGAGEMEQKQVILHEVSAERRLRQITASEPQHKFMPRVAAPGIARAIDEPAVQGPGNHRSNILLVAAGSRTVSPSIFSAMSM